MTNTWMINSLLWVINSLTGGRRDWIGQSTETAKLRTYLLTYFNKESRCNKTSLSISLLLLLSNSTCQYCSLYRIFWWFHHNRLAFQHQYSSNSTNILAILCANYLVEEQPISFLSIWYKKFTSIDLSRAATVIIIV